MNEHSTKSAPKDVFCYLLAIVTLYVGVVSFIALLFQYINSAFPDRVELYYFSGVSNTIRHAIASLIVVWPVYVLMSRIIGKDIALCPAKRDIKIRKWLLYLTLFIAAITMIVDLITLIHNFLSGELTVTFLLKTLSILIVSSGVFGYYLWDLKRKIGSVSSFPKLLAKILSAGLAAVIAAGFFIVGSPTTQRARRFDEERIGNLQTLQSEVVNYWTHKRALPTALDDLKNSITGFEPGVDPETDEPYEYNVKDALSFELCANFKTANKVKSINGSGKPRSFSGRIDPYFENWEHGQGRVCFTRTIDPDLYEKGDAYLQPPLMPPRVLK